MKFKVEEKAFRPFTITIETKKEAAMFFVALGNLGFSAIESARNNGFYREVREALKDTSLDVSNKMISDALEGIRDSIE